MEQRRDAATLPQGWQIFIIQESKAKVPQGGKDHAISHMWSKQIFRNVT